MPPAIGAIIIAALPVVLGAIGATALVTAAVTIAATIAVTLLTKKPKVNKINQGAELSTRISASERRQVLAGEIASGGSCHFAYTSTNDSKKPNRFLYRVIQISDQPINALLRVMDGTTEVTFEGDVTTGWRAATGYRTKEGNAACLWMRVYKGSFSAVADATLVSETGGLWTNNHKGTGLAYAIIKMDSDADAFPSGEPGFVFVVRGAHLYDDRLDSTVPGGSGAHRLDNYSTWAYSNTASVIIAQYLRGFYINGVRIVGVGADERDLSKPMLFSAHNTCEQLVDVIGGSEKRYAANLVLHADEPATSVLEDLQIAMDGKIYDRGGAITILPGAIRTPTMALTDQDIMWQEEKSWQPKASLQTMINCVTANFVDGDNHFAEDDLPVLTNAQWEIDDGDERFTTFFSLRAVTKRSQGQRITKRLHQASRYSGVVSHVGGIWLLEMEQGDWYTLTSPRFGFTAKYFEVLDITITQDLRVAVVGQEIHPDIDEWDYSVDEVPRDDSIWNLPEYELPVPEIYVLAYHTTNTLTGYQTFALDVGLVDLTRYGGFVKSIEVQVLRTADSDPADAGSFSVGQKKMTITGLAPELIYQVRARTSDGTRKSDWTDWVVQATQDSVRIIAGQLDYVIGEGEGAVRFPVQDYMPSDPGSTRDMPGQLFKDGTFDPLYWTLGEASTISLSIAPLKYGAVIPFTEGTDSYIEYCGSGNYFVSIQPESPVHFRIWADPALGEQLEVYEGLLQVVSEGATVIDYADLVPATWNLDVEVDWYDETGIFISRITVLTLDPVNGRQVSSASALPPLNARYARVLYGHSTLTGESGIWTIWAPWVAEYQPAADITAENAPIIIFPPDQEVLAAFDGTVYTGQLPRLLDYRRMRGSVDNTLITNWTAVFTNCTGTIDNSPVSDDRGVVELLTVTADSATISVTSVNDNVTLVTTTKIKRTRTDPGAGTGGGGGGGTPITYFTQTVTVSTTSNSYDSGTTPMAVMAVTAGGIDASIALSYYVDYDGSSVVAGKWQYSPAGAGTWTDMGSEVIGSWAYRNAIDRGYYYDYYYPEYYDETGYINIIQSVSGLAAGNYDVRLQLRRSSGTSYAYCYGTAYLSSE